MNGKIATMMVALTAIVLSGCCEKALKAGVPEGKLPAKVGPVFQVRIQANPSVSKLAVGKSIVLTATAVDENGHEVTDARFTWKCDTEGKISATEGKSVIFTLVKKPAVSCFVEVKEAGGVEGIIQFAAK